jgi:DNA modification methylase
LLTQYCDALRPSSGSTRRVTLTVSVASQHRSARGSDVDLAFARASWDFPDSPPGRELHPYPARFIPEIPAQALDVLKVDGPVLDPFCGSGTTLVEARRRGLASVGVDLNPIACLISRVRTHTWRPGDAEVGLEHSRRLRERALAGGEITALAERIPRLGHWFDSWASAALAGATDYLAEISDPTWHDRVAAAVSSTIVRISRQESDTRYAAIRTSGDQARAANEIGQAVVRVCDWLSANGTQSTAPTQVDCRDSRDLSNLEDDSFAASVFSPPYPNAYEYWLYHKYRMYWLGFDPVAVRQAELGARPHYCKPNGMTEVDFEAQMGDVFGHLARVLRSGAPAVVVVGDSVIGGRLVDNGALIVAAASKQGFSLQAWTERLIRQGRSSFNRAHSRGRKREHLLLLRAP